MSDETKTPETETEPTEPAAPPKRKPGRPRKAAAAKEPEAPAVPGVSPDMLALIQQLQQSNQEQQERLVEAVKQGLQPKSAAFGTPDKDWSPQEEWVDMEGVFAYKMPPGRAKFFGVDVVVQEDGLRFFCKVPPEQVESQLRALRMWPKGENGTEAKLAATKRWYDELTAERSDMPSSDKLTMPELIAHMRVLTQAPDKLQDT